MMNRNYFKIFKNAEDHYKWEKQKDYALIADGLDESIRKKYYEALVILEKILGRSFLKSSHRNNPMRQMIIEKTEFRIFELIEFAETLKVLETSDINFSELQKKLLMRDKSRQEGIPFVEIAQNYIDEKFKVSFPVENNLDKSPDIRVINPDNNETIYIEVSSLNENEERILIRENHYFFHKNFHYLPPQNSFIGKQKKIIKESEYSEISEIIAKAKERVNQYGQIVYYSDKRFYFLIAPEKYKNELIEISKKDFLDIDNIEGLSIDFNLTNQIISKIKKEANQIPANFNGLLYFPVSPLYFMTTDINQIIERLENYITNFKSIIGIVIFSKIVDNNKETQINIEKHIYRRKIIKNLSCESLYINNKNAEISISNETLNKIFNTL
jgi:hypothetical protein